MAFYHIIVDIGTSKLTYIISLGVGLEMQQLHNQLVRTFGHQQRCQHSLQWLLLQMYARLNQQYINLYPITCDYRFVLVCTFPEKFSSQQERTLQTEIARIYIATIAPLYNMLKGQSCIVICPSFKLRYVLILQALASYVDHPSKNDLARFVQESGHFSCTALQQMQDLSRSSMQQ